MEDFGKREESLIEIRTKVNYEVARWVVTHIWNSAGRTLKRMITNPVKSFPFTWDSGGKVEEVKPKQQSVDEMKEVMMQFVRRNNKKYEREQRIINTPPKRMRKE